MENSPVPLRFRHALADVVDRLAAGDFDGLKRDGIDPNPDADLGLWIRRYGESGATVVPLPEAAWSRAVAVPVDGRPGTWAVSLDIWTEAESPSDLSLDVTITEGVTGMSVTIDDLHVL